jgi:protein ImuB
MAAAEARIACILVADFPVAAVFRANPELRDRPFALVRVSSSRQSGTRRSAIPPCGWPSGASRSQPPPLDGAALMNINRKNSELSHVSPHARAAGIRPGMTVAQARALVPGLVVTRPSPAAERSADDALIDVAESLSPVVEEGEPGCVWLDLAGVERFFRHSIRSHEPAGDINPVGDINNEIADELLKRARRIGLEAAVGIASSKEVAHLAARCGGTRVIAPSAEREFLNWIPLDMLGLGADSRGGELELMLARLGIRRLGELARLDARAVGSRLGSRGVELIRVARGESSSPVVARPRVETFTETVDLEYGIASLEPLGFVTRAMLQKLVERLELRGFVAGDMTLSLGLDDHRRDDRRVAVAAPTNEVRSLLTLLNLSLEATPPPAAIETIRLTVEPRTPRPAQADMFLPPSPAPDKLATTIARIAALCGPDRVGMLMPANSWRPEAVRLDTFAPPPAVPQSNGDTHRGKRIPHLNPLPDQMERTGTENVARMVMRTIRPAEEVEVMCMREAPEFVRGARICARVVSAAGPWRRQGEWWTAADIGSPRPLGEGQGEGSQHSAVSDSLFLSSSTLSLSRERVGVRAVSTHVASRPHMNSWHAATPLSYARDYYELALADGGVYRMYRDLYSGKWFVDGIYD